jgi:hypothetical protein
MPFYYFDTTALIKRYSRERGTRVVNMLCSKRGRTVIVPTPTITEMYSTLALKSREGELTRDDWYSVLFKFEAESERGLFHFIAPSSQTVLSTKRLILEYPDLKPVQAMHLALALELRPLRLSVISSDPHLLEFCRPVGLNSINPEDDAS